MARSQAGSSTRTPPEAAPKSSARPSVQADRPVEHGRDQLEAPEVDARWPGAARGLPGSPPALGSRPPAPRRPACGEGHGRARHALVRDEQLRRIDRSQAGRPHLEPRGLALGAEPVLPARQHPQARAWVAVERQDDVDGVLERPRSREVAVLRDVARSARRRSPPLSRAPPGRPCRSGPATTPPGIWVPGGIAQRLDRVDREEERRVPTARRRARPAARVRARTRRPRPARRAGGPGPPPVRAIPRRRRAGRIDRAAERLPSSWSSSVDFPIPGWPGQAGPRRPARVRRRGRGRDRGARWPPAPAGAPSPHDSGSGSGEPADPDPPAPGPPGRFPSRRSPGIAPPTARAADRSRHRRSAPAPSSPAGP